MANPGAALGQQVGKLIERQITQRIREISEPRGFTVEAKTLTNGARNKYQIDCVVSDESGNPVIIVDPKFLRYTKHNRDKGSWLCTAHYSLRKTFPTVRKSITVLSGNWSAPSVNLIQSFGIEVYQIPFATLVNSLLARGITFAWHEKDTITPGLAWPRFQSLTSNQLRQIAEEVTTNVLPAVLQSVETTLDTDLTAIQRRVSTVEVLIKTTHDEFLLRSYTSVRDAMQALLNLLEDRPIDQTL